MADTVLSARTGRSRSDEWMSLADAARSLQAARQGSDLARLAHGLSQSDEHLLAFWALQVARIGVPVHGRRIMSTRSEVVPQAEMLTGRLLDGASRLNPLREQPTQDVCTLQVRRRDLESRLDEDRRALL